MAGSVRRVLVVGGGIAGAAVARHLGMARIPVTLVEKEPAIGGHARAMGCKATSACQRCNVCVAENVFRAVRRLPHVQIHTGTELVGLDPGTRGSRFLARLAHRPADGGRPGRKAAAKKPGPAAIEADIVVLATGYDAYCPRENPSFGYGLSPNILTGLDAEGQLARDHRIVRPSDHQVPRRVAFLQCVGSRTEEVHRRPEETDTCSHVCCGYALRMARRMKHQGPESEITVFYMDIQNPGKAFHQFSRECAETLRLVRARPFEVRPGPGETVRVRYAPEGATAKDAASVRDEEFDLVILSVGIRPAAGSQDLAARLRLPTDERGFFGHPTGGALADVRREGIYVAGACQSPKDIAGCLAQAEAIGAAVLSEV